MAFTSGLQVSTPDSAHCPELQLMALPRAHTKVGAEQKLCSHRNHGNSKIEESQGAPSGMRRKIHLLHT